METAHRFGIAPPSIEPRRVEQGMPMRGRRVQVAQPDGSFWRDMRSTGEAFFHPTSGELSVAIVSERTWYAWMESGGAKPPGQEWVVPADMVYAE